MHLPSLFYQSPDGYEEQVIAEPDPKASGMPTIIWATGINRDGIVRVLSVPLNSMEREAVESSATVLKHHIAALNSELPEWLQ